METGVTSKDKTLTFPDHFHAKSDSLVFIPGAMQCKLMLSTEPTVMALCYYTPRDSLSAVVLLIKTKQAQVD